MFKQATDSLAPRGTYAFVGIPPAGENGSINMGEILNSGRTVKGMIEGESISAEFIPYLIDLYMDGKIPFDRLVTYYDLADINQADQDNHDGKIVKAILRMPQ